MKRLQTWLIYNPISGGKKKEKTVDYIQQKLPYLFEITVIKTEYAGHAIKISKEAVEKEIDLIIAIGGDGTFHEIGTSIINSKTAMALVPMGSGNGLARYFSNNLNIDYWIKKITLGQPIAVDAVQWDDKTFINAAGLGFDAEVAHQFTNSKVRGFKKYVIEVCKALINMKTIEIDNQDNILMMSIMNGNQFGNNFILDASADIKDGQISKVIVQKGSLLAMLQFAVLAFHGKAHYSKLVTTEKDTAFVLESKCELAHLDGEPTLIKTKKHHIKVMPSSLKIWL